MNEFMTAALPWVLMGLALAIIAVKLKEKKSEEKSEEYSEEKSKMDKKVSYGMCIGMGFGVVLQSATSMNLGTSLAIGALWGMAIALSLEKE